MGTANILIFLVNCGIAKSQDNCLHYRYRMLIGYIKIVTERTVL